MFRGNSPNRRTFDLYTINVTGSGLKDVTKNPDSAGAINPDWSPNGKLIVFQRSKSGSGAGTGIYTIRPDGTGLKRLRIGGMNPAWSPSGAKIAFELPDPASGNLIEIYTMNAGGTGPSRLTAGKESVSPAWSPDGSQIVCIRDNQVTLVTVKTAGGQAADAAAEGPRVRGRPGLVADRRSRQARLRDDSIRPLSRAC